MPGAIGAAIIGAFGGTAAATSTAAIVVGSIAISGGMMGANLLVGKIIGKPKFDLSAGDQRFSQVSFPATDAPRAIIYGETRVGAIVTGKFFTGSKNEYMWVLYTLSGHEMYAIDKIFFDDEEVTLSGDAATGKYAGVCNVYKKLGASGETAFAELVSAGKITANDRQDGCGKVLVKVKWDADKFPNGYPQKVSFQVRGKKVYDPRDTLTKFSDNPALCFRDFVMDPLFGFGYTADEIDDASFITAANVCDESVALKAGGTIKRYTCNGGFTCDSDPFEIAKGILSSCAGRPIMAGGKLGIIAGAWIEPTIHLTDDDFASGLTVIMRKSRRELFNGVKGRFHNPSLNYEEDSYPSFQDDYYVAEDGQEFWTTLDLPFTNHPAIATRLAKIHLERHRWGATSASASYKLSGYQIQPGNTVYLSHPRYTWADKPFDVNESVLTVDVDEQEGQKPVPVLTVKHSLLATYPSVYSWNPIEEEGEATEHVSGGSQDLDMRDVHSPAHTAYRPLSNPLQATTSGGVSTINIGLFTMRVASVGDINLNGGDPITGLTPKTLYYVYYNDPYNAGGAVDYQATTTKEEAINGTGRYFVGSIWTPPTGGSDRVGNNDGGSGAETGQLITMVPSLIGDPTGANTAWQVPSSAFDLAVLDYDDGTAGTKQWTGSSGVFEGMYGGFPSFNMAWKSLQLKIRSSAQVGTPLTGTAIVQIQYSLDNGATWTALFSLTAAGSSRSLQTDTINIMPPFNPSNVRVKYACNVSSGAGNGTALSIYGIQIEGQI